MRYECSSAHIFATSATSRLRNMTQVRRPQFAKGVCEKAQLSSQVSILFPRQCQLTQRFCSSKYRFAKVNLVMRSHNASSASQLKRSIGKSDVRGLTSKNSGTSLRQSDDILGCRVLSCRGLRAGALLCPRASSPRYSVCRTSLLCRLRERSDVF